jgi:hypothetical protein
VYDLAIYSHSEAFRFSLLTLYVKKPNHARGQLST